MTWIIKKVTRIATHCGVAYESVHLLARGHVIRACAEDLLSGMCFLHRMNAAQLISRLLTTQCVAYTIAPVKVIGYIYKHGYAFCSFNSYLVNIGEMYLQ